MPELEIFFINYWLEAIYFIYALFAVLNVFGKNLATHSKIIWSVVILLLPILGACMFNNYIMAHRHKLSPRRKFNPRFNR
jgi:hypothetical protein